MMLDENSKEQQIQYLLAQIANGEEVDAEWVNDWVKKAEEKRDTENLSEDEYDLLITVYFNSANPTYLDLYMDHLLELETNTNRVRLACLQKSLITDGLESYYSNIFVSEFEKYAEEDDYKKLLQWLNPRIDRLIDLYKSDIDSHKYWIEEMVGDEDDLLAIRVAEEGIKDLMKLRTHIEKMAGL